MGLIAFKFVCYLMHVIITYKGQIVSKKNEDTSRIVKKIYLYGYLSTLFC